MKWQLSLILQVAHTYIISLAGYGMKNVVMGVGTLIRRVQQVPQKKCCANGALSSVSHNFDEELKIRFGMDKMPPFMRLATMRRKFCQDCTKYNNLFAMAATKVSNYCDNSGFTNQCPGHHCATLSGRVHHFFTRVSTSNPQSCGLSYFVFDSLASCACFFPNLEMWTKNY